MDTPDDFFDAISDKPTGDDAFDLTEASADIRRASKYRRRNQASSAVRWVITLVMATVCGSAIAYGWYWFLNR